MKLIIRPLLLLFFAHLCFSGSAFSLDINDKWKMHITNKLEVTHNDVWGPGQDNSFLHNGTGDNNWSFEDRIDFLNRLNSGNALYEFDINMRFTNNQRIDSEDATLLKAYLKRESDYTLMQAGDFFANFSQYSLNQNLKGILFGLKSYDENPWDFRILGGTYKPRWEYIWDDKASELKNTYFYGIRAGRQIGKLQLHANYVYTDEDRLGDTSINSSRSTAEIVHTNVGSMDWRFRPFSGLDLSGESAFSRQYSTTNLYDFGFANKVRARTRIKDLRTQFEYER
ncbi:MAG: hypothetical protein KAR20_19115, partial [Candidatus Heimdallarchaeota archaeon]|nr:hypothetical protein [Candidatus Heimdallarchaeota archaeon]